MTEQDHKRQELDRLLAMGRAAPENPSPRQLLAARMIDPASWMENAEEHIAWVTRHRMTGHGNYFGTMHIQNRRLALIQADLLLRALDRQAAGKSELMPFDARALSKRLVARCFELHMHRRDPRHHVSNKAADAVFFMRAADGVPAPSAELADDGAVTLAWSEDDRTAIIQVDVHGEMTLHLADAAPIGICFKGWRSDAPRTLAAVTDWVHHGGPMPVLAARGEAA